MESGNLRREGQGSLQPEQRIINTWGFRRFPISGYERERILLIIADQLKAAFDKEKRLKEPGTNLASVISHELRNTLSVILTSLSILETELWKSRTGESAFQHVGKIKSMVDEATILLDDVLYLDQLEQGRFELNAVEFDLKEFIESLVCEANSLLKQGQYIATTYSGNRYIVLDRKVLRYILRNLISNASKYSGQFEEIDIYCSVSDNIRIEVRDRGIGIPEQEQPKLFSPYFRAANASGINGIGLGLNIVKKFTQLLSGNISFSSKLNSGTSFVLSIPNCSKPG